MVNVIDSVRQRIIRACYRFMLPVARVLLANGISYLEFDNVCRLAFVRSASKAFGVRGRDTNNSRIAAMTGLPRRRVQELKETAEIELSESDGFLSPLADLLYHWATGEAYQDSRGNAKPLKMHEGEDQSFAKLVQSYIGDVPPGAVKAELLRLGAIATSPDGELYLKRRTLIPDEVDARLESAFVYSLTNLAETITHNCNANVDEAGRFFERFIESRPMSDSEIRHLRANLASHLKEISEDLDAILNSGSASGPESERKRIGIGLYYSES